MRRLFATLAIGTGAVWMAACGAPATNTPTNTNTNTNTNSKPVAAAPTADSLLALDKQANEAYFKGDTNFFNSFLSDKAIGFNSGKAMGKAEIVAMIGKAECEMKSYNLDDPKMSMIDADNYVLTYRGTFDGQCNDGPGGKEQKASSPIRAATLYTRSGDKWQAVWHSEVDIMDASGTAKTGDANANANTAKPAAGTEAKKEEAKPAEPKKDDKTAASNTANSNSNTAAAPATPPAKSANTDALVKAHAAGWEAFRNKDAKAFEGMIATNFLGVSPDGSVLTSRDAAIKEWTGTGTMKCEGITKTSFTDGFAWAVSPTVEILNGKGNSDGKCDGHPNGDLWNTAVYVKEGDTWKMAFMFESMPRKGM